MNASYRESAWKMTQGLVAFVCLAAATAVEAQTPKTVSALRPVTVTAPAATAQAEAGEHTGPGQPEPNDAAHQGVKVHGHWAINVKNPDGTVARHVEFENSLVAGHGDFLLALALTGRLAAADWGITLNDSNANEPVLCSAGNVGDCTGVSSLTGLLGQAYCIGSMSASCTPGTVAIPTNNSVSGASGITITGTIVPTQAGNITSVQTQLAGCTDPYSNSLPGLTSFSPRTCATSNINTLVSNQQITTTVFTSTSSFTPIAVAVDQVVAITVTITFS